MAGSLTYPVLCVLHVSEADVHQVILFYMRFPEASFVVEFPCPAYDSFRLSQMSSSPPNSVISLR